MNITNIRKNIDEIDEQILELLFKRFELIDKIIKYKQQNKLPVFDANREKEILTKLSQLGIKKGLSKKFIIELYQSIIDESSKIQNKVINNK